ncbi:CBASS cGAMP-activated phospholipase [Paenibacillus alkalitolerans]|uniref:CBASS cGAMP-activated phospholipase n=1 Tax=Paenibacillus alkalitolerans TaxID=2799335 RepID=UPI0018F3B0A7|nr:CBASS cGAMP-activated phospholipase [Paenibacillus alkalitolerans]
MRRILSIDGGGIKGVFPASFLASLEDAIGDRIANYFDLIVGTSTGGIIALGLGMGLTAKEILSFYESEGQKIFRQTPILSNLKRIGSAKYSAKPLQKALESTFGDKRLWESKVRLVIPAMNIDTGEVHVFKTPHKPNYIRDYTERAVDVALGTAAAPTFFRTHVTNSGTPIIDGGVWANNPVGVAVVEAIGVLNWPRDELKVLSLGCTSTPIHVGVARFLPMGIGYWGPRITEVFMAGQSSQALGTASLLAGSENLIRISPTVPNKYSLDGIKEIRSLMGLGKTEASKTFRNLDAVFFTEHAEPFVPFRTM